MEHKIDQELMKLLDDVARQKLETILRAKAEGHTVVISGVIVSSIELRPGKRTPVIVINGGERVFYPSRLKTATIKIV